jgi:Zn-dependent protease
MNMNSSLTLGRIFGIPIRLHISWVLIALLVTFSLAGGIFPQQYPGWDTATYWVVGAITAVLFFGSVLVHELGHSVVALREGIPVRNITLFIFGGVAQIGREPATAGAEFRVAIAGPLTSLALAAGFGALSPVLRVLDTPLVAMASYLAQINLLLAAFNMIPGFPLDGGRVLRSLIWRWKGSVLTATRWASTVGRGVAFVFIGIGLLQIFGGNLGNGLWIAFIGWYLNGAAQSSYQHVVLREMLGGVTATDVRPQQCSVVPGDVQLQDLVNDHVLARGEQCFFVAGDDDLQGIVTLNQIREVPRSRWADVLARQVMTPADALAWAAPDEEVLALLQRMDEAQVDHLPVVAAGRPMGMITRNGLLRYIRLRSELGA